MTKRTPAAPQGLRSRAKNLWTDLHKHWDFSPHELELLRLTVEAVSRAEMAQEAINESGLTVKDRFGVPREAPEVGIRTAAEASAARLLRQLGLTQEAERVLKATHIRSGTLRRHSERKRA